MAGTAPVGITDEGVARLRQRVGYTATSALSGTRPHNTVATADSFRHFAHGYGDDNPLWCDPDYEAAGPYGGLAAPPPYLGSTGRPVGPKPPPEVVAASAGALPGVQAFQAGDEWEFYRPVREGDRLRTANFVVDVEDKHSSFGGGRSVIVHHRQVWWRDGVDEDDRIVAAYHVWYVNTARAASAKAREARTSNAEAPGEPTYSDEQLAAVDAALDAETRRGAEVRRFEDVAVGDELPTLVKGPLTVADIISFHLGWGWSGQGSFSLRLARQHRRARPDLWAKNRFGAWDSVQRGHWEDDMAHKVGATRPYDYGYMRTCWLLHAVTDWMGDVAWLHRLNDRISKFNHVGDTCWIRGEVAAVDAGAPNGPAVTVALESVNQDDVVNASGTAEVLLPAAGSSTVTLPAVPDDVRALVERAEGR